jgi:hypothetical protein
VRPRWTTFQALLDFYCASSPSFGHCWLTRCETKSYTVESAPIY